ncbi:MAG: hypothetical protein ACQESH_08585 [Campylobacterota bacterium]
MHEIIELEKRWLKYKLKKYLWVFVLLLLLLVAILGYFMKNLFVGDPQKSVQQIPQHKNIATPAQDTNTTDGVLEKQKQNLDSNESNRSLKQQPAAALERASSDQKQKRKRVFLTPHEPVIEQRQMQKSTPAQPPEQQKKPEQPAQQAPQEEKIDVGTEKNMSFTKSEKSFDIKDVARKFEQSGDLKYAKTLANYYYDEGNYNRSSKWAYTMNQLDPSDEEGWLLFAKSLHMLGKKEDSIKVLRSYLRHYDSQNARKLLKDIIQGEF